jgi:uncharacterized protein with FMN-binding domain
MKRWVKIILLTILLFAIIGFAIYRVIQTNLEKLKNIEINPLVLSGIEDGVYSGKYSVLPISVTVQVSVSDHKIIAIEIVEHSNGQGSKAESITKDIILAQSIDVDVISGATYSSQVIKLAISEALK